MTQATYEGDAPFNLHVHPRLDEEFREAMMRLVVESCCGALLVLNFDPPISTAAQLEIEVEKFRRLFVKLGRPGFQFILAFIVTPLTTPAMLEEIKRLSERVGVQMVAKFFPIAKNGTTGAHWGLDDFVSAQARQLYATLERIGIRAMFHAEAPDPAGQIPLSQRERRCVRSMRLIRDDFPRLLMTIAHISTWEMCQFVQNCNGTVFGEVTPQHVLYDIYATAGLPHRRYMPRSHSMKDLMAIIELMLAGYDFIGAATDFAPHDYRKTKCCSTPTNGTIFAPGSEWSAYAELHRLSNKMGQLNAFLSGNAVRHYGFENRGGKIVLTYDSERPWKTEELYNEVMPANAGELEYWRMTSLVY